MKTLTAEKAKLKPLSIRTIIWVGPLVFAIESAAN
jgi:hypothetical protein